MSEYSQIQAKLINVLNRKVVKHRTVYKSDNNVILIDGKDKYYYTIHRMGNTNMGILIPSNMDNTKANCWYIVGKNLFDGGDTPDTHEYVDLGLPSGTLWATKNIQDADGNELYFAWGETQGYTSGQVGTDKNFTWEDYVFGTAGNLTKYNSTDGKTVLDSEDDAATANWGSSWRMPTVEQFNELIANTTTAWTQVNGVNGLLCTSTANTNTLFFPALGMALNGGFYYVGEEGTYLSISLSVYGISRAFLFDFEDGFCENADNLRCYGFSVRPVRASN